MSTSWRVWTEKVLYPSISDFYLVWENGDKARIKGLCIPSLRDIRSTPSECRRKIMNPNKDEVEPSENLTLRVDEVVTTGPSKPHKPVKQKPEQLGQTTPGTNRKCIKWNGRG
ncbi:hypothetical protein P3W45_001643 [Vairimorpha bombi]